MMEVIDKKYRKDCSYGSIKVGAVFKYNNEYYIKSDNTDVDTYEHLYALNLYALNLETGKTKRFAKNDKVLACDAKIYIE